MHGRGNYKWPDGRRYEGEYENDKKHVIMIIKVKGFGSYIWNDGRRYEGFWLNGK